MHARVLLHFIWDILFFFLLEGTLSFMITIAFLFGRTALYMKSFFLKRNTSPSTSTTLRIQTLPQTPLLMATFLTVMYLTTEQSSC
ncbi:hypothetical protein CPB83DRAFT_184068 [Crepidotus variabilis]|uniref:Uncharacterized protein n=1 Tax=Crepidotus variabilis TaxID=179855 RepID=A0A9P6JR81_9AGAR|nr:hypothetical protein CPB83DRAFT_184068 [Crepidotus variabilis]